MVERIVKGHALGVLVLGVIELVLALVIVICSFAMAAKADMPTRVTPFWAGIPFVIPGILGIVTGFTKNKCAMISFMVLNILCFILQGLGSILVAIVVAVWAAYAGAVDNCHKVHNSCMCLVDNEIKTIHGMSDCNDLKTISVLLYVIVIFLVIGAIVTLAASILGCVATCCTTTRPTAVIVQQPGMVMQLQNQQVHPEKQ